MRAVAERAWTTGTVVSLNTVIEPGLRVAAEIPGGHSVVAARFGADIICIGSHARAGFTAKVLGSVSLADESIIEPNKSPSGNCP